MYLDPSNWNCLSRPVYLDRSIWTHLFGPVYLDHLFGPVFSDIWMHLFGPILLVHFLLTRLFGPVNFDLSILTRHFGPIYLDPSIRTCLLLGKLSEVALIDMNMNPFYSTLRNISWAGGAQIVLTHLFAVHLESIGTVFPEKDPSADHDNLALALRHRVQPLAAALVRLPVDKVVILGPAEPEQLLFYGESWEGELWG